MIDLKHYRVRAATWDVFDFWIDASDADEAKDLARKAWCDGDRTEFRHRHGELDYLEAEEVKP